MTALRKKKAQHRKSILLRRENYKMSIIMQFAFPQDSCASTHHFHTSTSVKPYIFQESPVHSKCAATPLTCAFEEDLPRENAVFAKSPKLQLMRIGTPSHAKPSKTVHQQKRHSSKTHHF